MIWAQRDPWRWRHRFAWLPRKIDTRWVWLERYSWRPVPSSEAAVRYPVPLDIRPGWLEEFRYGPHTAWRWTVVPVAAMTALPRYWVQVRPYLKSVA